ncbi:hypothetical protein [Streptomyces sp. NPDC057690]
MTTEMTPGLLVLLLRPAAVYTWLDVSVPLPAVLLAGSRSRRRPCCC